MQLCLYFTKKAQHGVMCKQLGSQTKRQLTVRAESHNITLQIMPQTDPPNQTQTPLISFPTYTRNITESKIEDKRKRSKQTTDSDVASDFILLLFLPMVHHMANIHIDYHYYYHQR